MRAHACRQCDVARNSDGIPFDARHAIYGDANLAHLHAYRADGSAYCKPDPTKTSDPNTGRLRGR